MPVRTERRMDPPEAMSDPEFSNSGNIFSILRKIIPITGYQQAVGEYRCYENGPKNMGLLVGNYFRIW